MKERALWKNHFRAEVFMFLRHYENRQLSETSVAILLLKIKDLGPIENI